MSEYTDFLIVGGGIGGLSLATELQSRGLKAKIIDLPEENYSSTIAAGIVNPIAGKFFTLSWRSDDFFPDLESYYRKLEAYCGASFYHPRKIYRIFSAAGEQNIWLSKAHQERYAKFCSYHPEGMQGYTSPYGLLEINFGANLDTTVYLSSLSAYLSSRTEFIHERFEHALLDMANSSYKHIKFEHIVFCEGADVKNNPYFNALPFTPNKGELIEIECAGLDDEAILVGGVFVLPVGNHRFKVGATYQHWALNTEVTEKNRDYLTERFDKISNSEYRIIDQWAGIRPAVLDRRPILGRHQEHKNMHIFNGLGSKGVSMAPLLSKELLDYILTDVPLHPECAIERFL